MLCWSLRFYILFLRQNKGFTKFHERTNYFVITNLFLPTKPTVPFSPLRNTFPQNKSYRTFYNLDLIRKERGIPSLINVPMTSVSRFSKIPQIPLLKPAHPPKTTQMHGLFDQSISFLLYYYYYKRTNYFLFTVLLYIYYNVLYDRKSINNLPYLE